MKAKVEWNGGLTFTRLGNSGVPILIESDAFVGDKNIGVRPMEMIVIGLAGCIAMDVLSILEKKRQKVTSYHLNVDAPRSPDYPKVFTNTLITFVLTGRNIAERALLRSIELAATKYCPAYAMMEKVFPIMIGYEIYEEGEGEAR